MEQPLLEEAAATTWRENLARSLEDQRQRAQELLAGHRDRFRDLETQLTCRLQEITEALAAEQSLGAEKAHEVSRRESLLAERDRVIELRQKEFARRESFLEESQKESQEQQRHWLDELGSRLAQLDERQAKLEDEQCRLQVQQVAASRRELELERLAADLAERGRQCDQQTQQITQRQATLEQSKESLRLESEQLQQRMLELKQSQAEVERQREMLAERELETQKQRRHVAQQLRARKNELLAETELHRAEAMRSSHGEELQLQIRLTELQARHDRLREELAERDLKSKNVDERLATLQQQLQDRQTELQTRVREIEQGEADRLQLSLERDRLNAELSELQAELSRQRDANQAQASAEHQEREKKLAADYADLLKQYEAAHSELLDVRRQAEKAFAKQAEAESLGERVEQLEQENRRLEKELDAAQNLAQASGGGADLQELDDLRRRYEMSLQDVRELKAKNAQLVEQVSKAKQAGASQAADNGALGWEAQKQRLLQQLEQDFDENDEEQLTEKLKIEDAIRASDAAVADKDREIEELRQLLENQSDNIGNVAVGAAAIAEMLDSDELIRQERENLQQMQENLREQLRKAEVDISVERAKLARERQELEEKMQTLEAGRAELVAMGGSVTEPGEKGKKQSRGKWLTRLGLGEADNKG